MLEVAIHEDAAGFLARAGDWLLKREDHNNLFLSLSYARAKTGRSEDGATWAVVERDGSVVGCALRTPPHKVLLTEVPPVAIPALVRAFADRFDELPAVLGPVRSAEAFAIDWVGLRGGGWRPGMEQGVYRLDQVNHPGDVSGRMRRARPGDVGMSIEWGEAFARETGVTFPTATSVVESWIEHGLLYVWEGEGRPVSITVAHGRTPRGVRIGYVYTPPEERGHGYASALVAEVSQSMLDQGCDFCVLYTDMANPTSNGIYRRIGYRLIEQVRDFDILPPEAP